MAKKALSFLVFLLLSLLGITQIQEVEVEFYGEKHKIEYDITMLNYPVFDFNDDKFFPGYYKQMESSNYDFLLDDLNKIKQTRNLNDYLYYQLIHTVTEEILRQENEKKQPNIAMFEWFLLIKSNYDTRIEIYKRKVTLHVRTDERIYNTQQARFLQGTSYVDVTYFDNNLNYDNYSPTRVSYNPNKNNPDVVPFRFSITEMPLVFHAAPKEHTINFTYDKKEYSCTFKLDTAYIKFLEKYPEIGVAEHSRIPLSESCYNTLIPCLKKHTSDMTDEEICRFLLSFVRTGFEHVEDEDKFGKGNRRISAMEESLFNGFTDSEERAVMYNYLIETIVGHKAIILNSFKNYYSAINIDLESKSPIIHDGETYIFCDVNDEKDKLKIGEFKNTTEEKRNYKVQTLELTNNFNTP